MEETEPEKVSKTPEVEKILRAWGLIYTTRFVLMDSQHSEWETTKKRPQCSQECTHIHIYTSAGAIQAVQQLAVSDLQPRAGALHNRPQSNSNVGCLLFICVCVCVCVHRSYMGHNMVARACTVGHRHESTQRQVKFKWKLFFEVEIFCVAAQLGALVRPYLK